ncbi:MAG: AzlD domain-containing protein [Clostridia bacterium]|nr:AzlD domain-containing protein [Clostridia bacterium]
MKIYIYILISAVVSFLLRVLPLTLIRGKIENRFFRSFLYYVPYVTLAVMIFPAILHATSSPAAGLLALLFGVVAANFNIGLPEIAAGCCIVAFIFETAIPYFIK